MFKRILTAAVMVMALSSGVFAADTMSSEEYLQQANKRPVQNLTCTVSTLSQRPMWQRVASFGMFDLFGAELVTASADYERKMPGGLATVHELLVTRNPDLSVLIAQLLPSLTAAFDGIMHCSDDVGDHFVADYYGLNHRPELTYKYINAADYKGII